MTSRFSESSAVLAAALTLLAGYVDAIGYLTLGHVYVANMSGNSVSLGIHGAWRDTREVLRYSLPVIGFCIGLLVSRVLVSYGAAQRWRCVAAPAIAVEVAGLAAFALMPAGGRGIVFAASAMGVQAATLSRFNGVTLYTSFVTGTLVKTADHFGDLIVQLIRSREINRDSLRDGLWFAFVWVAYVLGAILGTGALRLFGTLSIGVVIACLALLAIVDIVWPVRVDTEVK